MKSSGLKPSGKPWRIKPGAKGLQPSGKRMKSRHRAMPPPTVAEQKYQDDARALGCVVCVFRIKAGLQPKSAGQCGDTHVHHRNGGDHHGQKQIGQHAVVALGGWHHDGVPLMFWGDAEMEAVYGVSFKTGGTFRKWTAKVLPDLAGHGTERWQAYQDQLISGEVQ